MDQQTKPSWLELQSIIPLESQTEKQSAERITGLSSDTLKRRYPSLIRTLSLRRRGMQLGDALAIASGHGMKKGRSP
jgi:hypothetical protein